MIFIENLWNFFTNKNLDKQRENKYNQYSLTLKDIE